MASFKKLKSGWQAQVARKGVRRSKILPTKREAQDWAAREEHLILGGAGRYGGGTVADLFERYARTESPKKKGERWEVIRLNLIARDRIGALALGAVGPNEIADWRDRRLKQVCGNTVRREMQLMGAVFEVAKSEWQIVPVNPMRSVTKPQKPQPRERRVTDDEVARLQAVAGTNLKQVKGRAVHAFCFAIETAMRAGEILALRRDDISGQVARLHTSKTGKGRDVPLSKRALEMWAALPGDGFELKSSSLDASFRKMRDLARIDGLTFHDSRHEAITRLSKKIHVLALARMVGHDDVRQLMSYYDESADDIAKLLD